MDRQAMRNLYGKTTQRKLEHQYLTVQRIAVVTDTAGRTFGGT